MLPNQLLTFYLIIFSKNDKNQHIIKKNQDLKNCILKYYNNECITLTLTYLQPEKKNINFSKKCREKNGYCSNRSTYSLHKNNVSSKLRILN